MDVLDAEAVRGLLHRYCEVMDAGDWDGLGALFADAVLADEHGTEIVRGAEAVSRFYAKGTLLHDGSPRTKHLVSGTALEASDDGSIVARSSYLVLQAVDGTPLQPIITGRYVDTFRRAADGRWAFAERRFIVDLMGDLSRHLRYAI